METTILGIMEKKMETTIMENQMEKKMENEMDIGIIYGLYWDYNNGKDNGNYYNGDSIGIIGYILGVILG